MTQTMRAAAPLTFHTPPPPGRRWRIWWIAGVSLVAHILIVWLLSFASPPPAKKPANIISARLLLPPPPISSTGQKAVSQNTSEVMSPEDRSTDIPPSPTTKSATKAAPRATGEDPPVNEPNASEKPVDETTQTVPKDSSKSQAATTPPRRINPRAALNDYMSATHQQAILEEAANADPASLRRGRTIDTSFARNSLSEKEFAGPKPTRVNCSSGINKTLALLSGIAGGTLRCSESPDLAPHIDKRLKAHTDK